MSISRLVPMSSSLGELPLANPLASTVMENNMQLASANNLAALEQSYGAVRQIIIFIRMQADLKMVGGDELFMFLNERYKDRLFFQYFAGYDPILKIKFPLEPVSIAVTTFQTRSWGRRFAMNEMEHKNFRMFMICNSEQEMRQVQNWGLINVIPVFLNGWVDILRREIAIEYQNYGHDYIIGTDQARRETKYFYRYNNNQVLNIYYSTKLEPMLNKIGKQFLKSPRFKNTRLKNFNTLEDLLMKFNDRRKVRKSTISRISQISSIGGTFRDPDKIQQKLIVDSETQRQKNLILIQSGHPQYQQIRVMVQDDKKDRWQMIMFGNGTDWQKIGSLVPPEQNNMLLLPEWERERIVAAEQLIVIIFIDDSETAYEFNQLANINFHSNLLRFDTPETLQTIMRQLSDNPKDFGLLILYEDRYEDFRDIIGKYIYQNADNPIDNVKILLKMRQGGSLSIASFPGERGSKSYLNHTSLSDLGVHSRQASYFISPQDILGEENPNILQQIFTYRNLYYHPAKGLMGRKIQLLINKNKQFLIQLCQSVCSYNRKRLIITPYNDRQHLNYLARRVKPYDNAIVVTSYEELPFVMSQIGGVYGVHAVLVTDSKVPKVPAQVLKQGTPREIQEFLMLIEQPIEDNNWMIERTYTDLARSEQSLVGALPSARSLERLGIEDQLVVPNQVIGKKKIVVRIPDGLDPSNVSVLQDKLYDHYGEEIIFKYYGNSEDIRDMDKWQQPLQFLIVTDEPSMLNWVQSFAANQINQRFEIILYTKRDNLSNFSYLTQDPRFKRFKLVSNSWTQIQQYIIGRDSRFPNMVLYPNQKIRIILSSYDKPIADQLMIDGANGHPIAQRCTYYYYDESNPATLLAVIQQIPVGISSPTLVIVNQSRQTSVNQQVAANILMNYGAFMKVLVIHPAPSSKIYSLPRTAAIVLNEMEAVRWIQSIRYMGNSAIYPRPLILVNRYNQYWRNYLARIASRRSNFKFMDFMDQNDLKVKLSQIASNPTQAVWILLDSKEQYQMLRQRIVPSKNIGYIVHSPFFSVPTQTQDLIFGSADSDEIQVFLQNYNKRLTFLLSPSHLKPNRRVMIVANRSIPLDQRQLQMWNRLNGAVIKFYDHESTLRKILDEYKQTNVFVILTNNEDQVFGEAIGRYPNVKRVVYNPQFKPRPFYESPSVAYVAQSNGELLEFMNDLRYLLRSPPYMIKQGYLLGRTNVFAPPNFLDQQFLQNLLMENQSMQVHVYTSLEDLIAKYNAVHQNCNNLILGDSNIENMMRTHNLFLNSKFINYSQFRNDIRGNTVLATDEINQIMLYLRNIPMTRFNYISQMKGLTGVYYNPNNTNLHGLVHQIDQLTNFNQGLNVYKYTDIKQIERNLLESPQNQIFIISDGNINHIAQLETIISRIPNKHIEILILSNDQNIPGGKYRQIMNREQTIIRFLGHIPVVTEQNISMLTVQKTQTAPITTKQSVTEEVVLVFAKRQPSTRITQNYVRVEQPPVATFQNHSRMASKFVQSPQLSKFTILKSVTPAANINLVHEIAHAASQIITTSSKRATSTFNNFHDLPKPTYQIIHKNRASMLRLEEAAFMQRSPRVELTRGVRDQAMKLANKPMIPIVKRVVIQAPPPPPPQITQTIIVPQVRTTMTTTTIVNHVAHPCEVALFFSDTPEGQRHAQFILRSTDEGRHITAIPFTNISQVIERLQRDYSLFDEIIILLDQHHSAWVQPVQEIANRFRRVRWFMLNDNDTEVLTKVSLVFNLGWAWKELEYPYHNQNFAFQQYNNIRFILPQPIFREFALNKGQGVQFYSNPNQIVNLVERSPNSHCLNIVVIPYSMLSVVYRLPFRFQNLRFVVLDDTQTRISQRFHFDNYGDMFWVYSHTNPAQIQQYLGSLMSRRVELTDNLPRNVLFHRKQEQGVAYTLPYFGYFKQMYLDQRDLEERLMLLRPNETPFLLKMSNGVWICQVLMRPTKKVSKVNIPRSQVSKVMAKPRSRPWILPNGEFINDTDDEGKKKQVLFIKIFNIEIFSRYNDFKFYYLSNIPRPSFLGKDIQARSSEQIFVEVNNSPQTMFLIFINRGDEMHLKQELFSNPRVARVWISDQYSELELCVRNQECQYVVQRVKSIERNSQIRYVMYRPNSSNNQLKLQELLMHERNIQQVQYNDLRQLHNQVKRLQGKYRQIDVIVFEDQMVQVKNILDEFRINPYTFITVKRDRERDRDSERNSEHQLRLDSRIGSSPYDDDFQTNNLGLLDVVRELGNLNDVMLLVDSNSNQRQRITNILGRELVHNTNLFNNDQNMRQLVQQYQQKPVIVLSDNPIIRNFAEQANRLLYIQCNPEAKAEGLKNTYVLKNYADLEALARILREYITLRSNQYQSNQAMELGVQNDSQESQHKYQMTNINIIAQTLLPQINGNPIVLYLPRDRWIEWKKALKVRQNIMIFSYTDQSELEKYLRKYQNNLSLILLPNGAEDLIQKVLKYKLAKIMVESGNHLGRNQIQMSSATQLDDLLDILSRRNQEKDRQRIEMDLQKLSRVQSDKIGYSMTLSLRSDQQKVHIFLTQKNMAVRSRVKQSNPNHVVFELYRSAKDLEPKLRSLGDNIGIIVQNDDEIQNVQRLVSSNESFKVYLIRFFSDPLLASKNPFSSHNKVIFTSNSSKEIANHINSLVYRSFKNFDKVSQAKKKKVSEISKSKGKTTTFGTTSRFDDQGKSYSRQNSNKILSRLSQGSRQ